MLVASLAEREPMTQLAVLGTGDAVVPDADVPAPIREAAMSSQPVLLDVPGVIFPDSPAAREACAQAYIDAGIAAARRGYDGLYINTVGDYGLQRLRQAVDIPVTGSGEAAIFEAREHGRFAFVTIWPPALAFIYEAILDAAGANEDCRSIYHLSSDPQLATLGQPGNFVEQMQACSLTSMRQIRSACNQALERDGADVVILGCTCMQPVAAMLARDGVPVIEPMTAGYRRLETLAGPAH
jgi:allantoin racemase